jgi:uncharacterized protein
MGQKNWILNFGIFLLILVFLSITGIVDLITDYFLFDQLNFQEIFLITLKSKVSLFFVSFFVFFLFAGINLLISSKLNDQKKKPFSGHYKLLILFVLSAIIGLICSSSWFMVQQFLNQVPFNIQDPIFYKDVSFYIFSLPFLSAVWIYLLVCISFTIILVLVDYLQSFLFSITQTNFRQTNGQYNPNGPVPTPSYSFNFKDIFSKLKRKAMIHIALLLSLLFILFSVKHYLSRFSIMYSKKGIVVGAGYADIVAYLPVMKILMVLSIVIAVLFFVWIFYFSKSKNLKKHHIIISIILLYLGIGFIGPSLITGIVQTFMVTPNEINLETPYIKNNIKYTKIAYDLTDVEEKDFDVKLNLDSQKLEKAKETIDNIRILDWRPLTKTYKQTQEIRLYYDLSEIDIDRYNLNGKYTEVMLSPRELDQNQIADNAKTWVNLHMVYTHGYGVVMSPVNTVTKEGMPNYIIKDIPPEYTIDEEKIKITHPQIYYGEKDNDYVLVNTKTNEFDYPKGDTNEYINYDGKGGVVLDSFVKKVLMAIRFRDMKILLSSDITSDSKIMYIRHIYSRISKITPFLGLDKDPYLVIHKGRLLWIQDAYTISNNFPYSEKAGNINYIRNSVKIVVDAYDGDITYYITDINDPLIITYAKIFPKQFKLLDSMDEELKKHIRYPTELFSIQSQIYNNYHMNDVSVFYNKEDAWQTPTEIYGVGEKVRVEPYYIIMKLPGEIKEEFILMTGFTPIKKDNMIAWMAARSDEENYGKLIVYKFPKDKLIYGPLQIEAKFDQDSDISQQITLWSQQGSQVTRGNLLVIPIDNSLLYIEPLYLQAEQGQLPELKRILASDGERVVMEKTLENALTSLFGKTYTKTDEFNQTVKQSSEDLISKASNYYDLILDSMKKNDWVKFGKNFDNLGDILNTLDRP